MLKDIALEPDAAFNFDELGNVYFLMNQDSDAEGAYREAAKLDPKSVSARLGLAKVYQRQSQYEKALAELQAAAVSDPGSARIHYLRGQILMKMGRKEEAQKELDTSVQMSSAAREQREKELEGDARDPMPAVQPPQ